MYPKASQQRVKFSNRFVERFVNWLTETPSTLLPDAGGLLIGFALGSDFVIQSFHVLSEDPELPRPGAWQSSFANRQRVSASNPELTWLDLIGWFALRPLSKGALLPTDMSFHNRNFRDEHTLAIIFRSITPDVIAAELRGGYECPFPVDKCNHVSVHFLTTPGESSDCRLEDEEFLRAYAIARALDRADRWQQWKERRPWLRHFERLRH